MELLALVHEDGGGPSLFRPAFENLGAQVTEVRLYAGERPERPPDEFGGVLTFGGTMHTHEHDAHPWLAAEIGYLEEALETGAPTLGVCLGAQLLSRAAGGDVARLAEPEIGWFPIELTEDAAADPVFSAFPRRFQSFQWHAYAAGVPPGAVELARSNVCAQAYRLGEAAWGVQFHPEVGLDQLISWISAYESPPVPPDEFIEAAERHIADWNELGRTLCAQFYAAASSR